MKPQVRADTKPEGIFPPFSRVRWGRNFPDKQNTQPPPQLLFHLHRSCYETHPLSPLALLPTQSRDFGQPQVVFTNPLFSSVDPCSIKTRCRPVLPRSTAANSPPFLIALIPRWKSSKLMTPSPLGSRYFVRSFTCNHKSSVTHIASSIRETPCNKLLLLTRKI